jgi:glycosyltransferase involved in cell wall biosynthesis
MPDGHRPPAPSDLVPRILFLIETLAHGGAEHQLVETVKMLDRTRFEPVVCHFRAPDYLAEDLRRAGIRVLNLEVPPGKPRWPELTWKLVQLAKAERPALIHTSLLEADVLGGVAGLASQTPVVSTLCNIAGDRVRLADNPYNNWVKFAATNVLWAGSLRAFHRHSIAISRAVRDSAVSTFGMRSDKMSVIYRGIEPSRPIPREPEVRNSLGFGGAAPFLLAIGRLAPQKGLKYLIAALPAVVRAHPRARLAIVGEGWLKPQLEEQARTLGVSEHVSFLGKRGDVSALLAACDVFVFPSLFEGLGVSLLEASYAGCACISTNTGPIPEIVTDGETGLLVPPGDSAALAAAIIRLAQQPEYAQQLGEAARARSLERFMLVDKVKQLEELYSRLLEAN